MTVSMLFYQKVMKMHENGTSRALLVVVAAVAVMVTVVAVVGMAVVVVVVALVVTLSATAVVDFHLVFG